MEIYWVQFFLIIFFLNFFYPANHLLEMVNLDADPCKDFFKFACGKFLKNRIPKDKVSIGTTDNVYDSLQKNLKS